MSHLTWSLPVRLLRVRYDMLFAAKSAAPHGYEKGPVAGALSISMEPTSGFEPLTHALRVRCSTS